MYDDIEGQIRWYKGMLEISNNSQDYQMAYLMYWLDMEEKVNSEDWISELGGIKSWKLRL